MKFRSEKGYTGIDISVSVIVITIFISLIALLMARFNSFANEIKYKEEAIAIAIKEIEKVKLEGFEKYKDMNKNTIQDEDGNSLVNQETNEKGYYKTIIVEDYTDIEGNNEKISGLVKKVTVKISYMFKGEEQSVQLSTTLAKEN